MMLSNFIINAVRKVKIIIICACVCDVFFDSSLRLETMTKPRKIAIFNYDQRGWQSLRKVIKKQLESDELDTELFHP